MASSFVRRLKYYGIGFAIGVVAITFILPNRGCSWTPANRVKNMILGRLITVNEIEWQLMQSKGLTKNDILSVLNDGDLNFKASKKDGDSKVYVIEKSFDGKGDFQFFFTLPFESYISEVKIGETAAKNVKNTTSGYGQFLSIPKDDYLVYPDSTAKVTCQMNALGYQNVKTIYKDIKQSGRINFEKTNFNARPKVEHTIEIIKNQDTIAFQSVWYRNKIFISNFLDEKLNNCN